MTSLYSECNNLSPDFFPELLLSSMSNAQKTDLKSDCKYTYNSFVLLGKTTVGAGAFALFVVYLLIPKLHLAPQFATLSIRSGPTSAQLEPEVAPKKQEFPPDFTREESTIGTALEAAGSGSGVVTPNVLKGSQTEDDVRRTTSSAVSIGPRKSVTESTLGEELLPQESGQLGVVLEQKAATGAPEVQEMGRGIAGRSPVQPTSLEGRGGTVLNQRPLRARPSNQVPISNLQGFGAAQTSKRGEIDRSQALPERSSGYNQPHLQQKKRGCSPCSTSIVSCCQNFFTGRYKSHARTLSMSGPPATIPAPRMHSFARQSTTNLVSEEPKNSIFPWEHRSTEELVQEFFSKATEKERDEYYLTTFDKISDSKVNEFDNLIDGKREKDKEAARKRVAEIRKHLAMHKCDLRKDETILPETYSSNYEAENYKEIVPWQQRLVLKDSTNIKPNNGEDFAKMKSHTSDITPESIASLKKELETCSPKTLTELEAGQTRALEVALKRNHLRVLPAIFDGRHHDQNLQNIVTILKHGGECKFSARKEVTELLEEAYVMVGKKWPTLQDTPISSSLPRNLFSIGKDNVSQSVTNPPDIRWISTSAGNKIWNLKVIKESIERHGNRKEGMIFVNQDNSHPNKHYEAYNEVLGVMDKDTMLLYAESIPYEDRFAVPK